MLEVRHLRTLIALAEAGTVSRAAERVHLTQSALSHQLKALESHYGLAMVKRHGQSVQLTEPGRRLVALGRTVMSEVQAAERDLAKLARKPTGTLRIALECHTCFDWLMPIMDAFRKHWPEVELDLVSGFHPNPLALLADKDRKSTRLNSSHGYISYAVFCLKKKNRSRSVWTCSVHPACLCNPDVRSNPIALR